MIGLASFRINDNAGTRTSVSVLNDRVTDLYIGKSAAVGSQTNAKFKMMSLAIWERSLSPDEINNIYIGGLCLTNFSVIMYINT